MKILKNSIQKKCKKNYDNMKILNNNLKYKVEFVIKNLLNFKTKKKENCLLIEQLINYITKIYENNDDENLIIVSLRDAQYFIPSKSKRLSTLLFTLRKELENISLYREIGVSSIFPDNTLIKKLHNNAKSESESESENEKLSLAMMNHFDDEWTKNLSIICVYGNINSHGNAYGHALLRLGNLGYLHIDNLLSRPTFIPHNKFNQYLFDNKSFVVDIQRLPQLPDSNRVKETIMNYANHRWFWQITHHNCLTFAREVAHKCGVTHLQLGGGRGQIKTPIDFFMKLDNERALDILSSYKKPGFFKKELIIKPVDNIKILRNASKQLGKNYFNPKYARVNISPLYDNPQNFFRINKNNKLNHTYEQKEKNYKISNNY